ncbi:MAG TPA: phosphoribosylanthranilate isomerase [Gammaproteobacteria bacterium]
MSTRIKICVITRNEDALYAAQLGVDAIGLVFHRQSPRYVSAAKARAALRGLPPFVSVVGLFMDVDAAEVAAVLDEVPLDLLQFHGRESAQFCRQFGLRYIKSVAMMDGPDVKSYIAQFPDASGFLLDAVRSGEAGGRGAGFDWSKVPMNADRPLILAGGLSPENVAHAIRQTGCYAVDVSSGVEADKGIKNRDKMRAFVEQVKQAV